MAEWGTKVESTATQKVDRVPVPQGFAPEPRTIYESHFKARDWIPDWAEVRLIEFYRKIYDYVKGTKTHYVRVKGKDIVVQWSVGGSPVAISTIIMAMIVAAIILGIALILTIVYKLVVTIIEVLPPSIKHLVAVLLGVGVLGGLGFVTYKIIRAMVK